MEFLYLSLIISSIIFLLFNKLRRWPNLPPGPWQLPFIGSIHHLLGGQLPHHRFRQLSAAHGPLMHLKLGEVSLVVASSPEAAREIMKTHDVTFANRPLFPSVDVLTYGGKTLSFAPYGEYWRHLRRICVIELFSTKRVSSFRLIREEEVRNLVNSISSSLSSSSSTHGGSVVNLTEAAIRMSNNVAARTIMGDRSKDQERFVKLLYEAFEFIGGFDLVDLFPWSRWLVRVVNRAEARVAKCHKELDDIATRIVREHRETRKMKVIGEGSREEEAEDFVDMMLRMQEEEDMQTVLSDDSIKALTMDLFGAGSETSSTTIQWAISELMMNPIAMKKAQTEIRDTLKGKDQVTEDDVKKMKYLELVIKETFRLHPPAPLLAPRECRENCKVLGYDVPAKSRVVVNVWAIGRDPKHWEDAAEFKPERFEGSSIDFKGIGFELLPFGAGRRMCPGMNFGLGVVELALANLLYHFDWELPTATESLDMSESLGISSHRKYDLLLRATSHLPLSMEKQV